MQGTYVDPYSIRGESTYEVGGLVYRTRDCLVLSFQPQHEGPHKARIYCDGEDFGPCIQFRVSPDGKAVTEGAAAGGHEAASHLYRTLGERDAVRPSANGAWRVLGCLLGGGAVRECCVFSVCVYFVHEVCARVASMHYHTALPYSTAILHCHTPLPYSTAILHCHTALPYSTAILHCHTPLPYSTAILHCHTPLPYCTAILHCHTPLPYSTAILHCHTPLPYSTTILHCHTPLPMYVNKSLLMNNQYVPSYSYSPSPPLNPPPPLSSHSHHRTPPHHPTPPLPLRWSNHGPQHQSQHRRVQCGLQCPLWHSGEGPVGHRCPPEGCEVRLPNELPRTSRQEPDGPI